MAKVCIDCGKELTNRRKESLRCNDCWRKYQKENKTGRIIGIFCQECGKELTAKKNKTGLCRKCWSLKLAQNNLRYYSYSKGRIPYNKGISKYNSEEEKREEINKRRREKFKNRDYKTRLIENSRTLIRNQFKRYFKNKSLVTNIESTKTEILLGCTMQEFVLYIESIFEDGMTWENYGNKKNQWNIDHIIPVSSCNFEDSNSILEIFNFKNCRPMWAIENFKKSNKIITTN